MRVFRVYRFASLIGIAGSLLVASITAVHAQSGSLFSTKDSIDQFLRTWDTDKTTYYVSALRDLNGDGIPEAIVYLLGRKWCGSGGCSTLILIQDGSSWRIVTKITITRPPIRVLTSMSHGWHDIGVWVQGGGVHQGYEADLAFNGKTYPRNPSVPPAQPLKKEAPGEVVISSTTDAAPLTGPEKPGQIEKTPLPRTGG